MADRVERRESDAFVVISEVEAKCALKVAKAAFKTAPAWEVVSDRVYVRSPETSDRRSFGASATIRLYGLDGSCRFADRREPGRLVGWIAAQDPGADIAVGTVGAIPVLGTPWVVESRQNRVSLLRRGGAFVEVSGDEFDRAVLDAANRAVAFKVPATAGLPPLSGSPKQVAWTVAIRADFARRHPTDARLKKAKTATFWIDSRIALNGGPHG